MFLVLIALGLFACKKENDGQLKIEGKISDSRNGTGVSSARVNLNEQVLDGGSFSSAFTQAGTTTTSGGGTFEVQFDRRNAVTYELEVKKEGFFDKVYTINPENVPTTEAYTKNGILTPIATLQMRLVNTNPLNQYDRIRFRNLNANFEDCECCDNEFVVLDGTNVDSVFQCNLHGDYLIKYVWEVTKNDTTSTYIDSLYCPAFMTSELEITY
ncbi:MAG: hypothetical protein ACPGWM_00630 [Flavobacteriales bacterium]